MIEVKELGVSFGEKVVFSRLNLLVRKGEFVTILGPSGCGKTTLFNCLAGFTAPDHGDISIQNHSVKGRNGNVGVIFQEYGIFPWHNVLKNILLGFHGRRLEKTEKRKIKQRKRAVRRVRAEESGLRRHWSHDPSGACIHQCG